MNGHGETASILTDRHTQFYANESESKKRGETEFEKELEIRHVPTRVNHPDQRQAGKAPPRTKAAPAVVRESLRDGGGGRIAPLTGHARICPMPARGRDRGPERSCKLPKHGTARVKQAVAETSAARVRQKRLSPKTPWPIPPHRRQSWTQVSGSVGSTRLALFIAA